LALGKVALPMRPMDIRALRQRKGQTQAEFAQTLGVGLKTLNNWEAGRSVPLRAHLDRLVQIARQVDRGRVGVEV